MLPLRLEPVLVRYVPAQPIALADLRPLESYRRLPDADELPIRRRVAEAALQHHHIRVSLVAQAAALRVRLYTAAFLHFDSVASFEAESAAAQLV